MSLSWLVPAFLAGLAAIVVPILVHLRQREQRDPIRFPSLMFLHRVPHRTTERRRITHPLLLVLRALAVAALVAAFARPFLRRADQPPAAASASRAVIVALDRSLSMSYRGVWDRARDSARAVLAAVGAGDRSALIGFDETAEIVAPLEQGSVAARLDLVAPTGRGGRLGPAVRAAREVAAGARGSEVLVVVISDLQRSALAGLEAVERIPGATLRFVAVGDPKPSNARVVDVDVDRRAAEGRTRLAVSAQIAVKGETGREVGASLIVNGRTLGTGTARLDPNGSASIRFDPVFIAEGDAVGAVALAPDALVADDTLRFSLASAAGVPVTLLLPPGGAADEALHLERALTISRSPALAITTRRAPAVPSADLSNARVIVVADVGAVSGAGLEALEAFARGGGGVILGTGARSLTAPAGWLPARVGRIVDRLAERGGHLGQLEGDHPTLEPFKEALASDFGAARFFRYRALEPDSSASVVARFDDGLPALVERPIGAGRVLMLGMPTSARWSDFPLQPVFLPLLQRLVIHAGQVRNEKRWYSVGEVVTLPESEGSLTVAGPPGVPERRLPPDSMGRTITLEAPGTYRISSDLSAAPIARLMSNPAPEESDLAGASPEEVLVQLKVPADSAGAPNVAPLTPIEQEGRQSWWIGLLLLVVALLAAETVYTWTMQRRTGMAGGSR